MSGHLAPAVQAEVERLHGLDSTTLAARVVDAARRAREIALEAVEDGDRASALRAIDTEMRTVAMLSAHGEHSEADVELRDAFAAISRAVYLSARRGERDTVETVAAELYEMDRGEIAEDLLDQIPDSRNELTS